MPAVELYGRRWHFSTDVVAIPAALAAAFHTAWLTALLVGAAAAGAWPGSCASADGTSYLVLFAAFLGTYGLHLALDGALIVHSLRGAPFEASKRRWVVPLLYAATAPLVTALGLTVWGTYVSTHLVPDCWPPEQRGGVQKMAKVLVFSSWAFFFIASLGIAITYNMYPHHGDLSGWEGRCSCIASLMCCHANVVCRPDGKRPPLSNIAELTAGLMSHCDLDATDITAALFLASAAQNRRRRLRVAKALLPVYRALWAGEQAGGGGGASGRSEAEETDDDASSATSVNDVPADAELDRWLSEQQAATAAPAAAAQRQQQQQPTGKDQAAGAEADGPARAPPTPALVLPAARRGAQGRRVRWAAHEPPLPVLTETAPAADQRMASPPRQQEGLQVDGTAGGAHAAGIPGSVTHGVTFEVRVDAAPAGEEGGPTMPATAGLGGGGATAGASLPLTKQAVARLDQQLAAMQAGSPRSPGAGYGGSRLQADAAVEELAGDLLHELPQELPPGQGHAVVGQLAEAIEEEIKQLGGGALPEDAVLHMAKEESLDLSALRIDPEAPSIWFSADGSAALGRASSRASSARSGAGSEAAAGGEGLEGIREGEEREEAAAGDWLAAAEEGQHPSTSGASPFAAASGAAASASVSGYSGPQEGAAGSASGSASEPIPSVQHAALVEVAAAAAMGDAASEASPSLPPAQAEQPPADAAAAAAVADAAAAAEAEGEAEGEAASEAAASSVLLSRQLTVKYPVVITPSEHVEAFRGPLPAAALADIYAGRHSKVPASVLREARHHLKFSYAVYSLEPKVEAPSSVLDPLLCCAAAKTPVDPQKVVFRGLSELEALEDDSSIELLHLNCSNRVLAHLPYMICLDHGKRAVVLAIRGTISAADIVTDAVVYPVPLDAWLPEDIKQELREPAFAHAGMVAAAKAIFADMTERGLLQELVEDEGVGGYSAPEQQQAAAGGGGGASSGGPPRQSQYDADAGFSGAGATRYGQSALRSGRGSRRGADDAQQLPAGDDDIEAQQGEGNRSAAGSSDTNQQSAQQGGAAGRLWEGASGSAACSDHGTSDGQRAQRGRSRSPRGGGGRSLAEAGRRVEQSPGRRVGEIMRRMIDEEGWHLIVQGHSLGAGTAALVSLKLRESFPGLKCIAFSCPGGLVSKNLAHAMAPFTTTVVVGKDAVCRATVGNLARLMDEMVTALARCRQPKLKVLFYPWWRRRHAHFCSLFYDYDQIPPEPLEMLQRYYDSRSRIGQPLSMYPPGRVLFLRPIKTRVAKDWDAVWISPEDLIAEGLLISPHMLRDHLCSTAFNALTAAAADRTADMERGAPGALSGEADARRAHRGRLAAAQRAAVARLEKQRAVAAAARRARQRLQAQRSSSLQDVLIEAA